MRVVELDVGTCTTVEQLYGAIGLVLGAPKGAGKNINALIDSMVHGGINSIDPPYRLRITGAGGIPPAVKEEMDRIVKAIKMAQGTDNDVEFQIEP